MASRMWLFGFIATDALPEVMVKVLPLVLAT